MSMSGRYGRYVAFSQAVSLLAGGGVLAFPTETFFGVGCSVLSATAVSRVYQVKKRSATKPLPILAADYGMLTRFVCLDRVPAKLLRYWPGPLTLVVPAKAGLFPAPLLDSLGRVAVRVTPHPVAAALSFAVGCPLTASSANLQGHPPARTSEKIEKEIAEAVDGVLEADPEPSGGLPSTIVEPLGGRRLHLLREGAVSSRVLADDGFVLDGAC